MDSPKEAPTSCPELISTREGILELIAEIRSERVLAIDTEFIRESTFFPIIQLIQVATPSKIWLVDARAFKKDYRWDDPKSYDPAIQPLLDLFNNSEILKVLHAAQADQECLYTSFGVLAKPSFDTAAAASLCGYGDHIGLGKLLKLVLDVSLSKGHARTNWSARPLPKQLLHYASSDVAHLIQLYQVLMTKLELMQRKDWAFALSAKWEDEALYQSNTEELAQKLAQGRKMDAKTYRALQALMLWRESRIRELNLPRRWLADDSVLLDLAQVRPRDLGHLSSFRGFNRGELKSSGEKILSLLAQAESETEYLSPPPQRKKNVPPSQDELHALALIQCYIGILADRYQIAARHLLSSSQILSLLRNPSKDLEDLKELRLLSDNAASLIGEDLLAMIQGKRSLLLKSAKVEIHCFNDESSDLDR